MTFPVMPAFSAAGRMTFFAAKATSSDSIEHSKDGMTNKIQWEAIKWHEDMAPSRSPIHFTKSLSSQPLLKQSGPSSWTPKRGPASTRALNTFSYLTGISRCAWCAVGNQFSRPRRTRIRGGVRTHDADRLVRRSEGFRGLSRMDPVRRDGRPSLSPTREPAKNWTSTPRG